MRHKGSRNGQFERRIPTDLRSQAVGLTLALPVGAEFVIVPITERTTHIKLSLRTADPAQVKARTGRIDEHLELTWANLRAELPASLTHKQAVALAGKLYRG